LSLAAIIIVLAYSNSSINYIIIFIYYNKSFKFII